MLVMPSGELGQKQEIRPRIPFFRLAFRPFFWLGACFSVVSIAVWALTFTGNMQFSPYGGSYFWHAHEMLFGFTVAIIVGFLLTAVQTWTKVPSIKGTPLVLLVSLWLSARIFIAFPDLVPMSLVTALDVLFLPLSALFLAIPIIKAKMWRNLFFVPILLVMAILNGLMHANVLAEFKISFISISHTMILMVALVMCMMGGRVFPMFTANGTRTERVPAIAWLEKLAIISIVLSIIAGSGLVPLSDSVTGSILILAGVANFVRAVRWRIWVTFKTPLVWSLHTSYWAVCLGLIMLGMVKLQWLSSASFAYHAITVGGIGGMILAMISRVSLGHTGRFIEVGKVMTLAFLAMVIAAVSRVIAPYFVSDYQAIILFSAALWCLAYGAFVVLYAPVLFRARTDGGAG